MTDVEKWKSEIVLEINKVLNTNENITNFNVKIENGVAVIEYSVKKIIPLVYTQKEKK